MCVWSHWIFTTHLYAFEVKYHMKYNVLRKQNNSEMCFVCGMSNDAGLHTKFYELEHKKLVGVFQGFEMHQSYPKRMHGGIITALLDETIGRAIQMDEPDLFGVTVDLNIRFLKPVPLDETLYAVGYITINKRVLFEGEGYLTNDKQEVLATCKGKYMKQDVHKIVHNNDFLEEKWMYVADDESPVSFELPL